MVIIPVIPSKQYTMKRINYYKKFVFTVVIALSISFTSCKDDDDDIDPIIAEEKLDVQNFIWKSLNQWYFWQASVPNLADDKFATSTEYNAYLKTFPDPEKFFKEELLHSEDRFSYITDDYKTLVESHQGVSKSNGLEFGLSKFSNSDDVFGYVNYIVPGSNAATKDIKRGDIFTAVNGTTLNVSNYRDLLFGDSDTYILNMASISGGTISDNGKEISLTKEEGLSENPVFIAKTFDVGGTKIGYLMYNGFTANYDTQLNNAFAQFKTDGATELVLDFRYNPGGSVNSSRLLASMVHSTDKSKLYIKQRWNSKIQPQLSANQLEDYFDDKLDDDTALNSLNLSRVYVLVTNRSASASELVINGLNPYMTVNLIGTTTTGKNEFSITFVDDAQNNYLYKQDRVGNINPLNKWGIQPLVGRNENSAGFYDYTAGFVPQTEFIESLENYGILGEQNEPFLAKAISMITGISAKTQHTASKIKHEALSNSKMHTITKDNMYLDKDIQF